MKLKRLNAQIYILLMELYLKATISIGIVTSNAIAVIPIRIFNPKCRKFVSNSPVSLLFFPLALPLNTRRAFS